MNHTRRSALIGLSALLTTSCAGSRALTQAAREPVAPEVAAHFVLARSPAEAKPQRWAVLLPGGSGLDIFGDRTHYSGVAQALAQQGFHAVAVDYRPAYWASQYRPGGSVGQRIAWVASEAVRWLREEHDMPAQAPGLVVGWSMGALGVWPLIGSDETLTELGLNLRAAATYYPATFRVDAVRNRLPLLVLTGEADDMTPLPRIRNVLLQRQAGDAALDLRVYAGAHHGFDVASLGPVRSERFPPLIGPKVTFGFDPQAAHASRERLLQFANEHVAV